jgi:rhamnose utilization protein RhaD (predicted bifunctional aldolase and dehydrogenase)
MNCILDLLKISSLIGKRIDYVQGGGGNISIKKDTTTMAIKASGYCLNNLTENRGIALVDYKKICSYLDRVDVNANNDKFNEYILSCAKTTARPSIETGLHSFFDKVVIHTHSVYTGVLVCSKDGEQIIKSIFPVSIYVPYCNPGIDVAFRVKKMLQVRKSYNIVFLSNLLYVSFWIYNS